MNELFEFPLVFSAQGVPLAGVFYRNEERLGERQRAVVVSGSWLNVKEQMATGYARALAARGFTTFVFDFSGWGESGGSLRHLESPHAKAREIAAAVDFVSTQSFVAPGGVGYAGVCASGQYALRAAAEGARIASLATVAGWFHDAPSVAPFYGGDAGVALRLGRAREAVTAYLRTGEIRMAPAYAPGNDRAGMHFELPYYAEAKRGAVPAWRNEMAEMSWLHWLAYDGLAPAFGVHAPTLMIHGDACALPDNARLVHGRLAGKKRLAWLDGAQTDYYDQPGRMNAALDELEAWFGETLQ